MDVAEACRRPFSEVATDHGVSTYRVVEALLPLGRRSSRSGITAGVVYGREFLPAPLRVPDRAVRIARRALAVANGRDQRAAEELLLGLSVEVRAGVEPFVVDCHVPFIKAALVALPNARVVVDKFHVVRSIDAAANRVRVRVGHKKNCRGRDGGTSRQHNPRNDPAAYRSRWVFAKRLWATDDNERCQLAAVFAAQPDVAVAWWMKKAFAAIDEAPDRADAERRLEVWEHNLAAAGLKD